MTERDDELVLVETDAMRARRAPLAIVWMWAFQGVAGALATWPLAAAVRDIYSFHPLGDAPLWKPGGLALMDALVSWQGRVSALAPLPILAFTTVAVLGLFPLALLLGQMAFATRTRESAPLGALIPKARAAFGPLTFALLAARLAELIAFAVALGVKESVSGAVETALGEARAQQVGGLAGLVVGALVVLIAVVHDLANAAIVRFRVRGLRSVALAFHTFRRTPLSLLADWAWRAVAMTSLVLSTSVIVERVGEAAATAGGLLLVFGLHQLVIFARLTLRASWLGRALRAVDLAYRVVPAVEAAISRGASDEVP